MSISLRLFAGYFLLIGLGGYLLLNSFMAELRPGVRQSMEDTMVDMANLLAEIAVPYVVDGSIQSSPFNQGLKDFSARRFNADIWDLEKSDSDLRVYITNASGIVIFDSHNLDLGANYSQWRDVYLTLRGKYGARTTRRDPQDDTSSVMHVAAPLIHQEKIIGVLTVAKPNITVQPFIELSRQKMTTKGLWLLAASLLFGLLSVAWLTRSIRKLVTYAGRVSKGEKAKRPKIREPELAKLGKAMETMRAELEGKNYVEHYIHTLTHEMKSPLSTIKGAAELALEPMSAQERGKFLNNILAETDRLQSLIHRLLELATVEKKMGLQQATKINLLSMVESVVKQKEALWKSHRLTVEIKVEVKVGLKAELKKSDNPSVKGERFLLEQSLVNLLDNAIAFSQPEGIISVHVGSEGKYALVRVCDCGPGIPDYASDRIFERFYSLPRPSTGKKSSGLGLSFVREVAELHGGQITLTNGEHGAEASLRLPLFT